MIKGLLRAQGTLGALLLLCVYFSWATYRTEHPVGAEAGAELGRSVRDASVQFTHGVIVAQEDAEGTAFAQALAKTLDRPPPQMRIVQGDPRTVRERIELLAQKEGSLDAVLTTAACRDWTVWDSLKEHNSAFTRTEIMVPGEVRRSAFLSPSNLRNVADQIAVIAIIAIGMTMVIITGGIDLSVGSLVALSAVVTAILIRDNGGLQASPVTQFGACLAAIAMSGGVGLLSGLTITAFRIPPFIATLAMMQVASGVAFMVAHGNSIYEIPPAFTWLGRGASLFSLPNAVVLMILCYVLAHVFMTRTVSGRKIYAVGGNMEASRLSGVRTSRTLITVYLISGLAAGVGGVIMASQLNAGAPTYGQMYELYVIAAVVVGGTSLIGGEGGVFGTLIGALIIGVIKNGMNLTGVDAYQQKVILGLVILGAVLLDMLKRRGWRLRG